jgi:hypothetical protein
VSENSRGNPNSDPRYNLNRLPDIEVPSRSTADAHQPPIAVTRNWIAGDFTGLREIAEELYRFAACSHDDVTELARYVENLIGDSGSWRSDTANFFRWSFGGDAMLINDLAQVAVAIGRVIENLANNLAGLEATVDNVLSPRIASGDFVIARGQDDYIFITVAKRLDGQSVFARRTGPIVRTAMNARSVFVAAVRKAKRLRREAATQLAVLCEPVNKNLGLYTSPDGEQREREGQGQGPLRHDQITKDGQAVAALQQQFKAVVTSGGDSGITLQQVNQALNDIGRFGGDVNTIGGVVADIKAMQHASALAQAARAGSVAQQVSSVVRDLLIILAVMPK